MSNDVLIPNYIINSITEAIKNIIIIKLNLIKVRSNHFNQKKDVRIC